MKIVIAGGTGFVGRALRRELLGAGHEVIVLTRQKDAGGTGLERFVTWDAKTIGTWATCLEGVDAVINLTGENIAAKRWTAARKRKILSSRVDATRAIVGAIARSRQRPSLLINASAVGFYGNFPRLERDETDGVGHGFLAATCVQWEAEAREARLSGVRVIFARLGAVLGEHGGMLTKMFPVFRSFLGAPLGSGKQWISWVHADDVAGAMLFLLEQKEFSGPVNITAPFPVTMKEFCGTLAKALRRPLWFPIPGFLLRLIMGEMAVIVLSSQKALPRKLLNAGFRFRYARLSEALWAILKH